MLDYCNFRKNKKWEIMFQEIEQNHPDIYGQIDDWYTSGNWEITIRLRDGSRWKYDGYEKLLYRMPGDENECVDTDEYNREFSRRLYRRMRDAGIGTEELSERLGISRVTMSKYINGHTTPNLSMLMKMTRILKCTPSDLMDVWERR